MSDRTPRLRGRFVLVASRASAAGWLLSAGALALAQEPVKLLADDSPSAVLRFEIDDASTQKAMPGRLTFLGPKGAGAKLFTRTDAAPKDLAVRFDVVYALRGAASITVPAGKHTVFASRGLEWGLDRREFDFVAGQTYEWKAVLTREIDTRGWIGADFHLHTRTFSGHGDANLEERVISLIGEGVEFAVATDHNHNTDYRPTVDALGAVGQVTAITGNEVSTPIGHFNTFPLDPERAVIDSKLREAGALFQLARAETNAFGIVPVIQLNHPRYTDIDWFGHTGLDAVRGESTSKAWSDDFDTLEVLNANNNAGYADADLVPGERVSMGCVLQDWFHLLNRGARHGAVGNSDSHTVHFEFAGFPRNFVRCSTDDPARIDPREIALALREKRMFTTSGPFVDFSIDRHGPGEQVQAKDQRVELTLRIQAASWVDVDRAKVWVNGELAAELPVAAARTPVRLEQKVTLPLERDAWVVVCVEGDDALAPLLSNTDDRHLPRAVTNPIWIDADGDGKWTSPWEVAQLSAANVETAETALRLLDERSPAEAALFVLATADKAPAHAVKLAGAAVGHLAREVRLAGARAAEQLKAKELLPQLERAFESAEKDGFARLCSFRALRTCKSDALSRLYPGLLASLRDDRREVYKGELQRLFPGRFVDRWEVRGPSGKKLAEVEKDVEAAEGKWREVAVDEEDKGFVDLRALAPEGCDGKVFAARVVIESPSARSVDYALGSDDGCVLRVNGVVVVRDSETHNAALRKFGKLELAAGANEVLLLVQNGKGASGLRLGFLDPALTWHTAVR